MNPLTWLKSAGKWIGVVGLGVLTVLAMNSVASNGRKVKRATAKVDELHQQGLQEDSKKVQKSLEKATKAQEKAKAAKKKAEKRIDDLAKSDDDLASMVNDWNSDRLRNDGNA